MKIRTVNPERRHYNGRIKGKERERRREVHGTGGRCDTVNGNGSDEEGRETWESVTRKKDLVTNKEVGIVVLGMGT